MTEQKDVQALKVHVALNVRNVEQSLEFYKKMLGIEPSKVRTGYAKFDVQNPPVNLTLNQHAFSERGALSHLGIQVASTEDVLGTRERWANAGLITRDEMQTSCCYAVQDKTWVRDPDGNEWEVFVVLQDNLAETAPCECGDKVNEAATESTTPTQISSGCCEPNPIGVTREPSAVEAACC
jgi:catechol 2,3-dioxygenase-like lactoylglutathione lyase family enzyme